MKMSSVKNVVKDLRMHKLYMALQAMCVVVSNVLKNSWKDKLIVPFVKPQLIGSLDSTLIRNRMQ
jgi:uncharacterized membrane protein